MAVNVCNGASMSRMKNALLLAIIILLALNLLLPVRYTLQLVPLAPPTQQPISQERHEPAAQPPAPGKARLISASTVENTTELTQGRPALKRKPGEKREAFMKRSLSHNERSMSPAPPDPTIIPETRHSTSQDRDLRAKKVGYDGTMDNRKRKDADPALPSSQGVNFHDPVQRMAYYRQLRKRLGGPGLLRQRKAERRMEMIHDLWGSWFENDEGLTSLSEYVTHDITPSAIETELAQCTTALGTSQESLESQRKDLRKSSIKMSAFLSAIKSLVPDSFSSGYASPCWMSDQINCQSNLHGITSRVIGQEGLLNILPNQAAYLARQAFSGPFPQRLYCLPHFFLAGFPKSATTTLADALYSHERVSSSVMKESHWWTRAPILSPDANLLKLNVLRYLMHFGRMAHFASEHSNLLSMDGSQSTLWDSNFVINGHDFCTTPAAISHILPKAKFIIVMREPSERLYSYYLWSCSFKYGNNTDTWPTKMREDPAGNFHAEISQAVTDFDNCLKTNSLYECANRYTFTNSTKVTKYCGQLGFRLVVSIYYIHIAKFLQFFPLKQFLFLKMEDMSQNPVRFMNRVTDFLDLVPLPPWKIRDLLDRKVNRQKAAIEPMHDDTRLLLQAFFAPHNRKLADLLEDDRFLWGY